MYQNKIFHISMKFVKYREKRCNCCYCCLSEFFLYTEPQSFSKFMFNCLLCHNFFFFDSLTKGKFLGDGKFKTFADNKIKLTEKLKLVLRKHCGKRKKCWLPAISSFPTMFSKAFSFRVVKSRDCVVNS